jgi:UDP-glucose 4-epimerase
MNIVITGAGGLVGSRLAPALAPAHRVWAVARQKPDGTPRDGVEWLETDLTSPDLASRLPASADAVIHLAQSRHYPDFPGGALDVFDVNVGSTARLLDWARGAGVSHFILASSGAVVLPGHEKSYYAASKRSAEMLAACYAHLFGVLVLRFHFVYGAGQRESMLVPRLVRTVRSGGEVRLAGPDGPRLNPVHVDDVVAAIAHAVNGRVTGTINVAGPDVLTIRQMCETIGQLLGLAPRFTADNNGEPADLSGDVTAMGAQLRSPRLRFEQGVADVIAALRNEA